MPEAWLRDSASWETWQAYQGNVMGAPDGPFQSMRSYEQQLIAIGSRLDEIERGYAENEAATADLFGRAL